MIYYLNDNFISEDLCKISIADRGFLLGDGVFTTLKSINGNLIHFDEHLTRLRNHAHLIKIQVNMDSLKIKHICNKLLTDNNLNNDTAIIRITVTRGVSNRGINIPQEQMPTILIKAVLFHDNTPPTINLCSTSIIRNEKSILTQIKSLNYLESILARDEATTKGYDDGIMFNTHGNITESPVSNIFFITAHKEVITPAISDGILSGIVREKIILICRTLNIPCIERSINSLEIKNFIAAFLTNSVFVIKRINIIDDVQLFSSDNLIINKIEKEYFQLIN